MNLYYKNDHLHLGKLRLAALAKKHGTPLYIYDLEAIRTRIDEFKSAFDRRAQMFYALKANSNRDILKVMKSSGVGIDSVSAGEIAIALKAGFKPQNIIFSGVGKTIDEIRFAISKNLFQINVESPQELERIGSIAKKLKKVARVAFRMNPDVNPVTHPYITTGFRENKFGMDSSFLPELKETLKSYKKNLDLQGLTLHIGSQILDFKVIAEAIHKTVPIYQELLREGHSLKTFDVGGGIGIPYDGGILPNLREYGQSVLRALDPLNCDILCEPGRILVGQYGLLLTQVQYIKRAPSKNFAIVDTGMHHLLRPALYQAQHRIWPTTRRHEMEKYLYDVVGPICESSDVVGKNIELHGLAQNDYLAILDVGAYGYSMASHYNAHNLPKEITIGK